MVESVWSMSCEIAPRQSLCGHIRSEVAVIGAGMAGILIAHTLREAGYEVVVLERDRIALGQTRGTTAKLTAQHGMIYQKLARTLGAERARQYAMANEAALRAYRELIAAREIDCDFEDCDAYVYGGDEAALRAEAETAAELGLPADYVRDTPLPFPTAGAVRFAGQARFHPLKLLKAVSEDLTVYERTPVLTVEDDRAVTESGSVRAEHIVFACHYPFVNIPGLYFVRMHQERSYVLALENAPEIPGMWIGAEQYSWSFRRHNGLLLFGGAGHRTGDNKAGGRYDLLREKAREWFPDSREAAHWSAQDCMTPDSVPYIGRYAASRPNWYVATGFGKWGMTSSMAAALLLRDLIRGEESPYAAVFDPRRFGLTNAVGVAVQSGHAVKGLAKQLFQVPSEKASQLSAGHGGIVFLNGKKAGASRDADGKLRRVDVRCPHMGCQLEWNPDEQSWDCPCHGSRFDCSGELLSGPAQRPAK